MLYRFSVFFLLSFCFTAVQAQLVDPLQEAQALSEADQFAASNQFLTRFVRQHAERRYDLARAWYLRSYNLLQLGDYGAAWEANEISLEIKNDLRSGDQAENYMRRGLILREMGQYEQALAALTHARQLPFEDAHLFALIAAYAGTVHAELKQWEQADAAYQMAQETIEIELGNDHPDLATLFYDRGRLALQRNRPEAASAYLERARAISMAMPNRPDVLGRILHAQGLAQVELDPKRAVDFYQMALQVMQGSVAAHYPELARVRLNLARELKQNDPRAAELQIDSAIQILTPGLPVSELPTADAVSVNPLLLAEALRLKSELLVRGDNLGAIRQSYPVARTAVELLARHLSTLQGENTHLLARESVGDVFGTAIAAAVAMESLTSDATYWAEALGIAELSKGLSLRALRQMEDEDALSYQLQTGIRALQVQYTLQPDNAQLRSQLAEAMVKWENYLANKLYPTPLEPTAYRTKIPGIDELRATLPTGAALLAYYTTADQYFVFGLAADKLMAKDFVLEHNNLLKKTGLGASIAILENAQKSQETGGGVYSKIGAGGTQVELPIAVQNYARALRKADATTFTYYGALLYNNLVTPVAPVLRGQERLVISPHGYLHGVPFAALVTNDKYAERDKIKWNKLPYLIDDYSIEYTYSSLSTAAQPHADLTEWLGIAPVFSDSASTAYAEEDYLATVDSLLRDNRGGEPLAALPYSVSEVEGIATLFANNGRSSRILLHSSASEGALREQVPQARYIHIASHAFANAERPALSGIVLAPTTATDAADGVLYADEIYALPLAGQTVVLSACESGSGEDRLGEGPFTPARAFLAAGAGEVIGTLWKVYDAYTQPLMQAFYQQLLTEETDTAAALRAAQRELAHDKDRANPRFWAGFILIR